MENLGDFASCKNPPIIEPKRNMKIMTEEIIRTDSGAHP
jgi:hypothetical protein